MIASARRNGADTLGVFWAVLYLVQYLATGQPSITVILKIAAIPRPAVSLY